MSLFLNGPRGEYKGNPALQQMLLATGLRGQGGGAPSQPGMQMPGMQTPNMQPLNFPIPQSLLQPQGQPQAQPPQTGMQSQGYGDMLHGTSVGAQGGPVAPQQAPLNVQAPDMTPPINPFAYQRQKPNPLGIIADALSGAAGEPGRYGQMLYEQGQTQRQLALQAMHIQQQQAAEYARQVGVQQFEVSHPKPSEFSRTYNDMVAQGDLTGANNYRTRYQSNGGSQFGGAMMEVNGQHYAPTASLDNQPTTEMGHDYKPGPGGRANPANWTPSAVGGVGPQGPRTFPAAQ